MMKARIALATLVVLIVPAISFAQAPHRYELTAFGGYRWGGEFKGGNFSNNPGVNQENLQISNGGNFGLVFDLVTSTQQLQFELMWERQMTSMDVKDNVTGEKQYLGDGVVDYLHLGVLYEVYQPSQLEGESTVRPFVGITMGSTRFAPSDDRSSAWRFSVGFKVGMKTYLAERIGLRLESSLMTTYLNSSDDMFCSNATGQCYRFPTSAFMNQIDVTAGLVFLF